MHEQSDAGQFAGLRASGLTLQASREKKPAETTADVVQACGHAGVKVRHQRMRLAVHIDVQDDAT